MNVLTIAVVSYALNSLWQVPLVAGAGWLVSRLCRQAHPRMLHRLWGATLLLAVLLPAAGMRSEWSIASAYNNSAGVRLLDAGAGSSAPTHVFQRGVLALPRGWIEGIAGVYLLLVLSAMLRLLLGVIKTQKLARLSGPVMLAGSQAQIWQRCRKTFSIGASELRTSDAISGPAVIGWYRPVLLLPVHFLEETTDDELLAALAHECAHIVRRDYLLNVLYECLSVPIAWHPVTAMLKAQLAQTREVACDQMVAEAVMQPTLYASALLRLASRIPAVSHGLNVHAVGIFDANIPEKRVMNLKTKRIALGWGRKAAMMAAAMFFAGGCAVSAVALSVEVDQSKASAVEVERNQIFHVGGDVSAPTLIYSVDPNYTEEARRAKYQGVCLVQIVVNAQGNVQRTRVLRALGMGLDKKAVQAVRQYRFTPAMRNGKPVQVAVNIEVNFRIY